MIHVARLGHADHRVQQQRPIHFVSSALGQLFMDTVQRVAGLEGDDVGVTELGQAGARLCGRQAQVNEVVVFRQLQHLQLAGDVQLAPAVHLSHQRMTDIDGAEGLLRYFVEIPFVDLLDGHHGQQIVLVVAQRDFAVELDVR